MPQKICTRCHASQPLENFFRKSARKDGRTSQCRECHKHYSKCYHSRTYDRQRVYQSKCYQKLGPPGIRRKLGITPPIYGAMLAAQSGVCSICGTANANGRQLAVDHDHVTMVVRGLLCSRCNAGLGQFRDNPDLLRAAIAYLNRAQLLPKKVANG